VEWPVGVVEAEKKSDEGYGDPHQTVGRKTLSMERRHGGMMLDREK